MKGIVNMCFSNPAWWALGISIFSLIISAITFLYRRFHYKGEIQRYLSNQAKEINKDFFQLDIKGPYAHHFDIEEENNKKFSAKAAILFHHLNMLRDVYENRFILGKKQLRIYEKWASTILRPWIESDDDLRNIWSLSQESKDLRSSNFNKWLNKSLPILKKK